MPCPFQSAFPPQPAFEQALKSRPAGGGGNKPGLRPQNTAPASSSIA